MDYGLVTEGSTRLTVPESGGISKSEEVFYNPHMRLNRDITVALCRLLHPATFLDSMAASGVRGIRVANEAEAKVTLNDLNPKAVKLIEANARADGREVEVVSEDARALMARRRWDFVDLDPFGPPVGFMDSAVCAVHLGGTLGVCATDTSALCGTYPKACLRKYDAHPLKADCYDELGLRILIGFMARSALRHERGIEPLFSHSTRHYMRVQAKIVGRPGPTMSAMRYLQHCPKCLRRSYADFGSLARDCECGERLQSAGPLWSADFAQPKLCKDLADELVCGPYQSKSEAVRLAGTVAAEQGLTLPYIDVHRLASRLGTTAPRMDDLGARLWADGFKFARTHFNDTGLRTDAGIDVLSALMQECGKAGD